MSVVNDLQQFGLSEKEATLYISLMQIEKAVVSDISKKSGLNRSTCYILLEALSQRGLVSVSEKNNVQYFSALPPKKLVDLAENRYTKAKELLKLSDSVSKELKKHYRGMGPRPTLKVKDGSEDVIKETILDFINTNSAITVFGERGEAKKYFEDQKVVIKAPRKSDTIIATSGNSILVIKYKEGYCYLLENSDLSF